MFKPDTPINNQWTVTQLIEEFGVNEFLQFDPNKDHLNGAVQCSDCGWVFNHPTAHWNQTLCQPPDITDLQNEVITGLLMGDGNIHAQDQEPHLRVKMITPEFLWWLHHLFATLSLGVSNVGTPKVGNHDAYEWRMRSHPKMKEYHEK